MADNNTRVGIAGASERTGIPVPTLRWYRVNDQGPTSYLLGGRLYYDIIDLDEWVAAEKAASVRGGVL